MFLVSYFLVRELLENSENLFGRDFVQYWSAGRLNLTSGNPYDPSQLGQLQVQTGIVDDEPILMWNPPWMLPIAMAFASLEFEISRLIWFIFNLVLIFISINITWQLYGGSPELKWIGWLVGFTFVPVLSNLSIGQSSALLLFGIVGFLYFMEKDRHWSAGILLALVMIKPHILYLPLLAMVLWSITNKEWRIILGAGIALAAASAAAVIFNPDSLQQYLTAARYFPPTDWATPTMGGVLRVLLGYQNRWLQFIPPLIGTAWMLFYWSRNRFTWKWVDQLPIVILVSTVTAPYGWTWDLLVAIIPVLQIAILIIPIWRHKYAILIQSGYLGINFFAFLSSSSQFLTFWFAPALLLLYLASQILIEKALESPCQTVSNSG
jgi:hypothetical protein